MMRYCLAILILFACLPSVSSAQTKKIYHKSHSGSPATFLIALDEELFGMESSDFGMAPERLVRNAVLDSLIFLSDSVTIMVTSEHCKRRSARNTTKWKAGKDTLVNHPDFTRKKSVWEIKQQLAKYYFNNPPDSVKFINVVEEEEIEYQILPPAGTNDDQNQGPGSFTWIGLLSLTALLWSGLYYYLKSKLVRKHPARQIS